jgi:hypothetical protein
MFRFTLIQLFLAVTLLAIGLLFLQTEGCGTHYSVVESLAFSTDGTQLAVSKLDARDTKITAAEHQHTLARTLSWLNAKNGALTKIIDRETLVDQPGSAHDLWKRARPSLIWSNTNQRLLVSALDGDYITSYPAYDEVHAKSEVISFSHTVDSFALSQSGQFLAASGYGQLTLIDLSTNQIAMQSGYKDSLGNNCLWNAKLAFLKDESRVISATDRAVVVWETPPFRTSEIVLEDRSRWLTGFLIASDGTLLVGSDDWVRRYELTGEVLSTCSNAKDFEVACYSPDEKQAALVQAGRVDLYKIDSGEKVASFHLPSTCALTFSPDGSLLATGDTQGKVTVVDVRSGQIQWSISPAGRFRWPWTIPFGFLLAWLLVVVLLWWKGALKRSRKRSLLGRHSVDQIGNFD